MKFLKVAILLLWGIGPVLVFSQDDSFGFIICDKSDSIIEDAHLLVDDTTYVCTLMGNDIKLDKSAKHSVKWVLYGEKIIDTTFYIKSGTKKISLKAKIKTDGLSTEFNKGFMKVYTDGHSSVVIGLVDDSIFIRKSFFHTSIAACYQFEKGKYRIRNNILYLNVYKYESPCFQTHERIEHRYEYPLIDDKIVDINKYSDYIEKVYSAHKLVKPISLLLPNIELKTPEIED